MTSSQSRGPDPHETMLIELHDRFYQSLQVISSAAGRLARDDISQDKSRRIAKELENRIGVLSELHLLLAKPVDDDLGHACEAVCRALASAYDRHDVNLRITLPVWPPDPGIRRGFMLMLAELVTDALKRAPSDVPLDLHVALTSSSQGYDLQVRTPAPAIGPIPFLFRALSRIWRSGSAAV